MCDSNVAPIKDIFLFHKKEDLIIYADESGNISFNREFYNRYLQCHSNFKNFRDFFNDLNNDPISENFSIE